MNLLCLSFGHDGLAAVFKDGRLVAAIATERLTRIKKARGIDDKVVDYVLSAAGMKWSDIQLVVLVNWFFDRRLDGTELFNKKAAGLEVLKADGSPIGYQQYFNLCRANPTFWGTLTFQMRDKRASCLVVDHHFAHCAYAYYMSPYDRAVVISVDGADNLETKYSVHYFDDEFKSIACLNRGHDFVLGGYYACLCDYLGFYPSLMDCGKVMALAAYGKPLPDYEEICRHSHAPSGTFVMRDMVLHTLLRHGIRRLPQATIFQPPLKGEGGVADPAWLDKNDWKKELNRNIAATAQAVLEKSLLDFTARLADTMRNVTTNLCLSGGTMLNCVCNGKILNSGLFENVFVAPAASDDGGPIGAGLFVCDHFQLSSDGKRLTPRSDPRPRYSFREAFEGGRRYSLEEINAAIERARPRLDQMGISFRKLEANEIIEFTANKIIADKIIGWFYRGSELGPRALGHRSLLANPRNPEMKDILNNRVKHREEFRPFAPVILEELAAEWFDLRGGVSPFMLFSVPCLKPDLIPSAVHIDGTARVQTVDRENNGRLYEIVSMLNQKTGVPVVLNTSFNVQGEPIVETPDDAIRCFLGTEIDLLVLEDYVLEKPAKV